MIVEPVSCSVPWVNARTTASVTPVLTFITARTEPISRGDAPAEKFSPVERVVAWASGTGWPSAPGSWT